MKRKVKANYIYVTIDATDWSRGVARDIINTIKKETTGYRYLPDTKEWKLVNNKVNWAILDDYETDQTDWNSYDVGEFLNQFNERT